MILMTRSGCMAIAHQTDKRSGITYAYEAIYHWDKDKKQSRAKRTLIGRVDIETGAIIPTDGRMKKNQRFRNFQIDEVRASTDNRI
jgi:uncharacterized protein YceK